MAEPKRIGRPLKRPGEGKAPTVTFRCRPSLHERVRAAAADSERSLSEEVERRLEASFAPAPDLRTLIREEIRAALAERDEADERVLEDRLYGPRPEALQYRY